MPFLREVTSHKVNGLNEAISIRVIDEPGPGGANHIYDIEMLGPGGEESIHTPILFQNGPIKEGAPNGVSNESLLAIVEDRLKGFQSGQFACRENAIALTKIQEALHWLHHRTRERVARGVEGTSQK